MCWIFRYQTFNQTNKFLTIQGNLVFPVIFKICHFGLLWDPHHCDSSHLTPHTSQLTHYITHHIPHTKHHTPNTTHPTPHSTHQNSTHFTSGVDASGEMTKYWVGVGWRKEAFLGSGRKLGSWFDCFCFVWYTIQYFLQYLLLKYLCRDW